MKISKESVIEIALGVLIAMIMIELGGFALNKLMDRNSYDDFDEDEYEDEDFYDEEYYEDPNEMVG